MQNRKAHTSTLIGGGVAFPEKEKNNMRKIYALLILITIALSNTACCHKAPIRNYAEEITVIVETENNNNLFSDSIGTVTDESFTKTSSVDDIEYQDPYIVIETAYISQFLNFSC